MPRRGFLTNTAMAAAAGAAAGYRGAVARLDVAKLRRTLRDQGVIII